MFLASIACAGIAVLGRCKSAAVAHLALIASLLVLALVCLLSGVGYAFLSMSRESLLPLLDSALLLLLAAAVARSERLLLWSLPLAGAASIVGRCVQDCLAFDDCRYLRDAPPVRGAVLVAVGAAYAAFRAHVLRSGLRGAARDQTRRDAMWARLAEDPPQREALALLAAAADRLSAAAAEGPPARQLNRVRCRAGPAPPGGLSGFSSHRWTSRAWTPRSDGPDGGGGGGGGGVGGVAGDGALWSQASTVPGEVDEGRPVRCPDQLYAQALLAAGLLDRRLPAWAAASRGACDPAGGGVELGPGQGAANAADPADPLEAALPPAARGWVRGGRLKPPSRAVEKALMCYGGDASRLLDVCRGRLAFRGPADLRAGLEAVGGDPGVRVVRVRNGLRPEHGARCSAGFRVAPRAHDRARLRGWLALAGGGAARSRLAARGRPAGPAAVGLVARPWREPPGRGGGGGRRLVLSTACRLLRLPSIAA
jgi:hypothetical protein